MPEPSDHEPQVGENTDGRRELPILGHLVQRIKSQPLLLAVAVLLILANLAAVSVEALRALLPAALTVFVVAILAWVGVELLRLRRRPSVAAGEKVRIAARKIGKSGEVLGVDDESGATPGGSVDVTLKVQDVQGKVVGVRRGPRRP